METEVHLVTQLLCILHLRRSSQLAADGLRMINGPASVAESGLAVGPI